MTNIGFDRPHAINDIVRRYREVVEIFEEKARAA
jgi:hypothetical protein